MPQNRATFERKGPCVAFKCFLISNGSVLKAHCRDADWVNKPIKKNRIWQLSVISLYREIHEDDNDLTAFILETKYDPRA